MIESGVVAPGSVKGILTGKHYNRCIRAHKVVYEAIQRLRFVAFCDSLPNNEVEGLNFLSVDLLERITENLEDFCSTDQIFIAWKTTFDYFVQR